MLNNSLRKVNNMFAIYRGNKRYNNKVFASYEAARSYTRKIIRNGKVRYPHPVFDFNAAIHRNPTISAYGFTIKPI